MISSTYRELPCDFRAMEEAVSLADCQRKARAELAAELTSFVVRSEVWQNIVAEAGNDDPGLEIFQGALGGSVHRSLDTYIFDGTQPLGAHVDEVYEDLLGLRHHGRFNSHKVKSGAVSVCMLFTTPGYYTQGGESRIPRSSWNFGITQDIQRRQLINPYSSSHMISEARLQADDRVIFFERSHPTIDGPPNVIHLFDRGTIDRCSETAQYYADAA